MIETSDELSKQDLSYLQLAVRAAQASPCNQKHGAVVVRGGSVLAIGFNKWRSSLVGISLSEDERKNMSIHAEMDALSRVKNKKGVTIYVARVNKHGNPMFSRPCNNCHNSMLNDGIKRIVFTNGVIDNE